MTRVVERCATCGVEHEVPVAGCEACGGALRWWCRAHSGEIGWLESAECRGCVEEKARPKPLPRPVASAPRTPLRQPARTPPPARRVTPTRRVTPVAPVRSHGPPVAGTPLADILERKGWEGEDRAPLVITVLRIWIPCIALFSLVGIFRGAGSGRIGEFVYRGALAGWMVGLLLVLVVILAGMSKRL